MTAANGRMAVNIASSRRPSSASHDNKMNMISNTIELNSPEGYLDDAERDRFLEEYRLPSSLGEEIRAKILMWNPPGIYESKEDTASLDISFYRQEEKIHHDELVSDGGRPWYPISLIKDVSENPRKYYEMLWVWSPKIGDWDVFKQQLWRWQDFRCWQRDHRGVFEKSNHAANVTWRKRLYTKLGDTWNLSQLEGDEKLLNDFEWWKFYRKSKRKNVSQFRGDYGFPKYIEAVKKRLAQHGFTRALELDQDHTRQDKLTTWMEYLYYESWWHDRHIAEFKSQQTCYEMAWKEVVDLKAELADSGAKLMDWNSVIEHEHWLHFEEEAAREAAESAKSAMSAEMTTIETRGDLYQSHVLLVAGYKLDKANRSMALIKEQSDRIGFFYRKKTRCEIAQKKVDNHSILLHWILKQISLIEAELEEAKVAGGTSGGRNGGSRRDLDNAATEDQKCYVGGRSAGRRNSLAGAQTKARRKRSCHSVTVNEESSPQQLIKRARFEN